MTSERYEALHAKYFGDGEQLLADGDLTQASEKIWGAVATMIKFVAARRSWRHFSHRDLVNVLRMLRAETGDSEYVTLFQSAERLHANFYENVLEEDAVKRLAEEATRLIEKLRVSARGGGAP